MKSQFKLNLFFLLVCWLLVTAFVVPRTPKPVESMASYMEKVDQFYYRNVVPEGHQYLVIGSDELAKKSKKGQYAELLDLQMERARGFCEAHGLKGVVRQIVKFETREHFKSDHFFILKNKQLVPIENYLLVHERDSNATDLPNSEERANRLLSEMDYDNVYRGSYQGQFPHVVLTALYCATEELDSIPL